MRVGLVLGAGGVVGASWMMGALEALESETGWDPATADSIIGTSAGSVIGSLIAAGISAEHMTAYTAGGKLDELADTEERGDLLALRQDVSRYRPHIGFPPIGPGSWRMALNTVRHPLRHAPAAMLSAWLPRGFISTRPIAQLVDAFIPGDWPDHPDFRAVAADYGTGKRVAFDGGEARPARVCDAVAASCAIPGFYHPVSIDGRRYVDGGICSLSNLDLLCDAELDLVVCLNPTSSLAQVASRSPAERFGAALRSASGKRVGHEARKLRATGTEVLLVQPSAADIAVMGVNYMARGRRLAVTEQARKSTALHLRELRGGDTVMPGRRRRRKAPRGAPAPVRRAA
jgi:NTE family protein